MVELVYNFDEKSTASVSKGQSTAKFPFKHFWDYIIGRAKRAPHCGVQSRFRMIYI